MSKVLTTCPFCGCGCGVFLEVENERVHAVAPQRSHPTSRGTLCVKGWNGHQFIHSTERLTKPMVKKNGQLKEAVAKLERSHEMVPEDQRVAHALDIARKDLADWNAKESKRIYQEGLEAFLGGNTKRAEEKWKQALELDSQNDDALNALLKLEEQKKYENPNQTNE